MDDRCEQNIAPPSLSCERKETNYISTNLHQIRFVSQIIAMTSSRWRSKGGMWGTRPGAQALGAHQHTFCSRLKTRVKQKLR